MHSGIHSVKLVESRAAGSLERGSRESFNGLTRDFLVYSFLSIYICVCVCDSRFLSRSFNRRHYYMRPDMRLCYSSREWSWVLSCSAEGCWLLSWLFEWIKGTFFQAKNWGLWGRRCVESEFQSLQLGPVVGDVHCIIISFQVRPSCQPICFCHSWPWWRHTFQFFIGGVFKLMDFISFPTFKKISVDVWRWVSSQDS